MILLDTHIWVRWLEPDTDPLPAAISRMIDSSDKVTVSAVSCWEAAYLAKRNRIMLPLPMDEWLQAALDGTVADTKAKMLMPFAGAVTAFMGLMVLNARKKYARSGVD